MSHVSAFWAALAPPPDMKAWEWCEANIILSPKQSTPFPGPYRTSLIPYIRGIFDMFQDPGIHTLSISKGAQTGFTQAVHCWHVYRACEDPGPALIIMPNERQGRSISETRIQTLFKDSPRARLEIQSDPNMFKILEYRLNKCQINLEGSNSASGLASRTVRDLTMDETDKYPIDMKREASPPSLAEQRSKAFWNRNIIKISTPTTSDGYINRCFLEGDQRRYHVPCPHCQEMNHLKWTQFKFDSDLHPDEAGDQAFYECETCGGKIEEKHRSDMMEAGEWRATAKSRARGVASVHIPSYYSPWVKWGELVSKFLRVKDVAGELRNFINSDLGEPWKVDTMDVKDDRLTDRRGDYTGRTLPSESGVFGDNPQTARFITVDVQKFHLWVCVREWSKGGDSALIMYDKAFDWKSISDLGDHYDVQHIFVDCGYAERKQEVFEACHEYMMIPCFGASGRMTMSWTKSEINIYEGTRKAEEGVSIAVIQHDTSALKFQLFDRINGAKRSGDPADPPTFQWWIPRDIDDDYCAQVTAEYYDESNDCWKQLRRDNHATDCEVMQILAATYAGYHSRVID